MAIVLVDCSGWAGRRESVKSQLGATLKVSVLTGALIGIIISLIELIVLPFLPELPIASAAQVPIWVRLGASFGGLVEEIVMRLFLMSLLVLLLTKVEKSNGLPSGKMFWLAIVIAAIAFGLSHLPSASLFLAITPLVVVAALVLNGIAGIAFGYLYWKRGIESAMLAHFVCNIFLWVINPVFI